MKNYKKLIVPEDSAWNRKTLSARVWRNTNWRIRDFLTSCNNIIKWAPTIWKDRDWDDSFIFDILTKKLKNQADYIGKKDRHTRAKRDAEVMMTCVRLLEKVKTEEYGIEHFDYEKSDWDFVPCEDHPGYSTLEVNRISENFDDYFKKYPRQYKRVMNGEINRFNRDITELTNDKHNIAMEIAHENHERARKLVFKMLEQNIEKWWD